MGSNKENRKRKMRKKRQGMGGKTKVQRMGANYTNSAYPTDIKRSCRWTPVRHSPPRRSTLPVPPTVSATSQGARQPLKIRGGSWERNLTSLNQGSSNPEWKYSNNI
ncbi:hypothetical protein CHS0354_007186 [Potamilus streckersoni]|uniref:Uncharacterized protein n=1 Tax=Potamilus streckersoni TaxID=2493646 RepID=A0AAE0T7J9_9BIVA|nr:hypothetical protein CHS0354_007186 [Potamilus streckersoni]